MGCEYSSNQKGQDFGVVERKDKRKREKVHGKISSCTSIFQNVTKIDKPITKDEQNQISKIISEHFIFFSFSKAQKLDLIREMAKYSCKQDEYVFKQGTPGSLFFIIKSGKIAVQINQKFVKHQEKHEAFGDLSLLYTAPRSASIKAVKDCIFWCLHQQQFKSFVKKLTEKSYSIAKPLITQNPLFEFMTKKQINSLSFVANCQKYQPNQIIFKEGDDANACYLIKSGEVKIKIPHKDSIWLKSGEIFGQNSFKTNQIRLGTATAGSTQVMLVSISRQGLIQALGGKQLSELIQFNILRWAFIRSKIFKNIPSSLIPKIMKIAEVQEFNDNQIIIKKKQKIKHLLIPIDGKINDYKAGNLLNEQYFLTAINQGKARRQQKSSLNEMIFECRQNIKKKGQGRVFMIRISELQKIFGFNILKKLSEKQVIFDDKQISLYQSGSSYHKQITQIKINLKEDINLGNLKFVSKIGEGQFGEVFLVETSDGTRLALKCIKKKLIAEYGMESLIVSEKQVLSEINHPMIVQMYKSFKDDAFVYLLLEYINGCDLFDALRDIGICTQSISRFYLASIILAIEELHSKNIIYRDLKPQNAVVDTHGYLHLIDMGATKKLTEDSGFRTFTVIGTPHYMAPQAIQGKGYSFQIDIWSMGVILYEMVCGHLPFGEDDEDTYTIYKKIIKQKKIKFPGFYKNSAGRKLIQKLMEFNPNRRSIDDFQILKNHPYFQNFNWSQLYSKKAKTPYIPEKSKKKTALKQFMSEYLKKDIEQNKISKKQCVWDVNF